MKQKKNWFLRIIMILFLIFISLFIVNKNGYYETKIKKETILTDQKIKEFENDIKEGKVVDINNYYVIDKKNYNNKFNKAGEKFGMVVNNAFLHGFKNIWEVFKVLFV